MDRFVVEGGEVHLLATVQGLVAEADRVREAFAKVAPRALAIGLSPEAVGAVMRYEKTEDEDPFEDLPDSEYAYSVRLGAYGPIGLPAPDLVEAIALARASDVPIRGVDLTEEEYETVFTTEVGTFALLWYGRVQRALARRPPKAPDARSFSLAWDARVRRIKGFARVEARREARIAEGARALAASTQGPVLLLVDAAREAGVAAALAAAKP